LFGVLVAYWEQVVNVYFAVHEEQEKVLGNQFLFEILKFKENSTHWIRFWQWCVEVEFDWEIERSISKETNYQLYPTKAYTNEQYGL